WNPTLGKTEQGPYYFSDRITVRSARMDDGSGDTAGSWETFNRYNINNFVLYNEYGFTLPIEIDFKDGSKTNVELKHGDTVKFDLNTQSSTAHFKYAGKEISLISLNGKTGNDDILTQNHEKNSSSFVRYSPADHVYIDMIDMRNAKLRTYFTDNDGINSTHVAARFDLSASSSTIKLHIRKK
ncbi:hypothetical protein, partial [Pseudoalteromonas sp. BMB]|uniref:hypothetical protein n=1 Tax=Pseudoalteromonas sp. BMB TaxID=1874619 RepID=UPI001586D1A6